MVFVLCQAHMQEFKIGGSIVDPRHGGLGAQPPAAVAYLTKDNPENQLLIYTAIK